MSYIATIQGVLRYPNEKTLAEVLDAVENQSEQWASTLQLDADTLTLTVPKNTYRGLGRNLDILTDEATDGWIVGTSNEPSWHGFVHTVTDNGGVVKREIDLNDYVELSDYSFSRKPHREDYASETSWHDKYVVWQSEVESAFIGDIKDQESALVPHSIEQAVSYRKGAAQQN